MLAWLDEARLENSRRPGDIVHSSLPDGRKCQSLLHSADTAGGEKAMPTRNVVLTDHQESLIGALVDSGRYQNASEVLREGLRMLEQREAEDAARLDALRRAVDIGRCDIDQGRFDVLSGPEEIAAYLDEVEADVPPSFHSNGE